MLDVLATGYPSLDYICQVSHTPAVGETGLLRSLPARYSFGGCGALAEVKRREAVGERIGGVGRRRHVVVPFWEFALRRDSMCRIN